MDKHIIYVNITDINRGMLYYYLGYYSVVSINTMAHAFETPTLRSFMRDNRSNLELLSFSVVAHPLYSFNLLNTCAQVQ